MLPITPIYYGNVQNTEDATLISLPSNHDKISKCFIENFIQMHYQDGDMILVEGILSSEKVDIHKTEGIPDDGKFYQAVGWEPLSMKEDFEFLKKWDDLTRELTEKLSDHDDENIALFLELITYHISSAETIDNLAVKKEYLHFLLNFKNLIENREEEPLQKICTSLMNLYDLLKPYGWTLKAEDIKFFIIKLVSFLTKTSHSKIDFNEIMLSFNLIPSGIYTAEKHDLRDNFLAEQMEYYLKKFAENKAGQKLFVINGGGHTRPLKTIRKPKAYHILKNHPESLICMPKEFHCHTIPLDANRIHPIKKSKIGIVKVEKNSL